LKKGVGLSLKTIESLSLKDDLVKTGHVELEEK
jgi:hypothetical protein